MGTGRSAPRPTCDPDAWYLHDGRMSPGVMIESGQADLLLARWLGVDFRNRGERVYRLLGCELTFKGGLPRAATRCTTRSTSTATRKPGDTRCSSSTTTATSATG